MTADRHADLATLTLAACRAVVGTEFARANESGPDVHLSLVTAEVSCRDPLAAPGPDRPFVLLFRGPDDPVLTQGMHDLDHPILSLSGVFLTRVMHQDAGAWYEAVFT